MARPDTQKIGGLKKKRQNTNPRGPIHRKSRGPRYRDGKARYTENQRTKKNDTVLGARDTGRARPDTQKIGGLKKKK